MTSGWLKPLQAAKYLNISERTLRSWLKAGLRHSKIGGNVLIKISWLDEFAENHECTENKVDRIVAELNQ